MEKKKLSIIGLGQVGTALLRACTRNGYRVVSVFNRSDIPKYNSKIPRHGF